MASPHLERAFGHVSADRGAGRWHGGWRNASSSLGPLAATARKDAEPLTDQSLPEFDESLAPLGLIGSGGLFFARVLTAGIVVVDYKTDAQSEGQTSTRQSAASLAVASG